MPSHRFFSFYFLAALICLLSTSPLTAQRAGFDSTGRRVATQRRNRLMQPQRKPAHDRAKDLTGNVADGTSAETPRSTHATTAFDPSPLELDQERFNFQRDWWKYSIMLVVFALCSFLLLKVAKQVLAFAVMLACIAGSAGVAYITGPALAPYVTQCAPGLDSTRCPALYWAYGLIFIVTYAIATLAVRFVKRPMEGNGGSKGTSN